MRYENYANRVMRVREVSDLPNSCALANRTHTPDSHGDPVRAMR